MLAIATVHGFLAGTDRSNRLVQWAAFVVLVGIVFLVVTRILSPSRAARAGSATAIREPTARGRRAEPDEVAV